MPGLRDAPGSVEGGNMFMFIGRRSILNVLSLLITVLVVLSKLALAQHQGVSAPRPVAPVHVSPPPVYHPPVIQTPVVRPPINRSPIYSPPIYTAPRTGMVPSAARFGTSITLPPVRPVPGRPIRPVLPVVFVYRPQFFFGDPFWRLNSCWSTNCELFWPWTFAYTNYSTPAPVNYVVQPAETPVYIYGGEREDYPQLFLRDGTVLNVTDYWVLDDQLHFKLIEAIGQKPVEHSIPFEDLDLQTTIDANTARGFRFVLRNAPVEQYLHDHPEEPPPAIAPPHP